MLLIFAESGQGFASSYTQRVLDLSLPQLGKQFLLAKIQRQEAETKGEQKHGKRDRNVVTINEAARQLI
jgi:hypothetical protein